MSATEGGTPPQGVENGERRHSRPSSVPAPPPPPAAIASAAGTAAPSPPAASARVGAASSAGRRRKTRITVSVPTATSLSAASSPAAAASVPRSAAYAPSPAVSGSTTPTDARSPRGGGGRRGGDMDTPTISGPKGRKGTSRRGSRLLPSSAGSPATHSNSAGSDPSRRLSMHHLDGPFSPTAASSASTRGSSLHSPPSSLLSLGGGKDRPIASALSSHMIAKAARQSNLSNSLTAYIQNQLAAWTKRGHAREILGMLTNKVEEWRAQQERKEGERRREQGTMQQPQPQQSPPPLRSLPDPVLSSPSVPSPLSGLPPLHSGAAPDASQALLRRAIKRASMSHTGPMLIYSGKRGSQEAKLGLQQAYQQKNGGGSQQVGTAGVEPPSRSSSFDFHASSSFTATGSSNPYLSPLPPAKLILPSANFQADGVPLTPYSPHVISSPRTARRHRVGKQQEGYGQQREEKESSFLRMHPPAPSPTPPSYPSGSHSARLPSSHSSSFKHVSLPSSRPHLPPDLPLAHTLINPPQPALSYTRNRQGWAYRTSTANHKEKGGRTTAAADMDDNLSTQPPFPRRVSSPQSMDLATALQLPPHVVLPSQPLPSNLYSMNALHVSDYLSSSPGISSSSYGSYSATGGFQKLSHSGLPFNINVSAADRAALMALWRDLDPTKSGGHHNKEKEEKERWEARRKWHQQMKGEEETEERGEGEEEEDVVAMEGEDRVRSRPSSSRPFFSSSSSPASSSPLSSLLDFSDRNGSTALYHAAWEGYSSIVSLLCEFGAELNHRNVRRHTAMDMAVERGHDDVVRIMLRYGADSTRCEAKAARQRCRARLGPAYANWNKRMKAAGWMNEEGEWIVDTQPSSVDSGVGDSHSVSTSSSSPPIDPETGYYLPIHQHLMQMDQDILKLFAHTVYWPPRSQSISPPPEEQEEEEGKEEGAEGGEVSEESSPFGRPWLHLDREARLARQAKLRLERTQGKPSASSISTAPQQQTARMKNRMMDRDREEDAKEGAAGEESPLDQALRFLRENSILAQLPPVATPSYLPSTPTSPAAPLLSAYESDLMLLRSLMDDQREFYQTHPNLILEALSHRDRATTTTPFDRWVDQLELYRAVMRGDVGGVARLLSVHPELSGFIVHGCSLMFHAAYHGRYEVARMLMAAAAEHRLQQQLHHMSTRNFESGLLYIKHGQKVELSLQDLAPASETDGGLNPPSSSLTPVSYFDPSLFPPGSSSSPPTLDPLSIPIMDLNYLCVDELKSREEWGGVEANFKESLEKKKQIRALRREVAARKKKMAEEADDTSVRMKDKVAAQITVLEHAHPPSDSDAAHLSFVRRVHQSILKAEERERQQLVEDARIDEPFGYSPLIQLWHQWNVDPKGWNERVDRIREGRTTRHHAPPSLHTASSPSSPRYETALHLCLKRKHYRIALLMAEFGAIHPFNREHLMRLCEVQVRARQIMRAVRQGEQTMLATLLASAAAASSGSPVASPAAPRGLLWPVLSYQEVDGSNCLLLCIRHNDLRSMELIKSALSPASPLGLLGSDGNLLSRLLVSIKDRLGYTAIENSLLNAAAAGGAQDAPATAAGGGGGGGAGAGGSSDPDGPSSAVSMTAYLLSQGGGLALSTQSILDMILMQRSTQEDGGGGGGGGYAINFSGLQQLKKIIQRSAEAASVTPQYPSQQEEAAGMETVLDESVSASPSPHSSPPLDSVSPSSSLGRRSSTDLINFPELYAALDSNSSKLRAEQLGRVKEMLQSLEGEHAKLVAQRVQVERVHLHQQQLQQQHHHQQHRRRGSVLARSRAAQRHTAHVLDGVEEEMEVVWEGGEYDEEDVGSDLNTHNPAIRLKSPLASSIQYLNIAGEDDDDMWLMSESVNLQAMIQKMDEAEERKRRVKLREQQEAEERERRRVEEEQERQRLEQELLEAERQAREREAQAQAQAQAAADSQQQQQQQHEHAEDDTTQADEIPKPSSAASSGLPLQTLQLSDSTLSLLNTAESESESESSSDEASSSLFAPAAAREAIAAEVEARFGNLLKQKRSSSRRKSRKSGQHAKDKRATLKASEEEAGEGAQENGSPSAQPVSSGTESPARSPSARGSHVGLEQDAAAEDSSADEEDSDDSSSTSSSDEEDSAWEEQLAALLAPPVEGESVSVTPLAVPSDPLPAASPSSPPPASATATAPASRPKSSGPSTPEDFTSPVLSPTLSEAGDLVEVDALLSACLPDGSPSILPSSSSSTLAPTKDTSVLPLKVQARLMWLLDEVDRIDVEQLQQSDPSSEEEQAEEMPSAATVSWRDKAPRSFIAQKKREMGLEEEEGKQVGTPSRPASASSPASSEYDILTFKGILKLNPHLSNLLGVNYPLDPPRAGQEMKLQEEGNPANVQMMPQPPPPRSAAANRSQVSSPSFRAVMSPPLSASSTPFLSSLGESRAASAKLPSFGLLGSSAVPSSTTASSSVSHASSRVSSAGSSRGPIGGNVGYIPSSRAMAMGGGAQKPAASPLRSPATASSAGAPTSTPSSAAFSSLPLDPLLDPPTRTLTVGGWLEGFKQLARERGVAAVTQLLDDFDHASRKAKEEWERRRAEKEEREREEEERNQASKAATKNKLPPRPLSLLHRFQSGPLSPPARSPHSSPLSSLFHSSPFADDDESLSVHMSPDAPPFPAHSPSSFSSPTPTPAALPPSIFSFLPHLDRAASGALHTASEGNTPVSAKRSLDSRQRSVRWRGRQ